jgi:methylated-DNA-protein-cysteine methyltransferase-like protein
MIDFDLPPAAKEHFYQCVWKIVRLIPPGKVTTYGHIASYIPCPAGVTPEEYQEHRARWVGKAMNASPDDVPWQRVINSQGKISFRQSSDRQHRLLEAEGVLFDTRERVNLQLYGWEGPEAEWLRSNDLLPPDQPQQLSFSL